VSTQTETPALDEFAAAIDRDGEIPIGVQLGWALRGSIRDGRFSPRERLPGLRELADAVGVNVNTVRAVYQRLEREGLIDSRQGSGTFVAPGPPQPSTVTSIAADAAREAHATGADPREVAAALYVATPQTSTRPGQTASPAPGSIDRGTSEETAVERRRALRSQIATLEQAIGEIEVEHPGVAPRPTATRRGPGPALLSAAELEQVRSELVRRLATVQTAIDEQAAVEAAGDERSMQKKVVNARVRAGARTRARVHAKKDNTSTPDPDPTSTPASTPKRPTRPRSTPRPAAAGT
jgi:DNA-binding transcriptional regulator YhcF (GntR family)